MGHYTTLRCMLVICACEILETMHLDIKCAFQNGKLYDIVYVVHSGELGDNSGLVWKLKRALYGHKQAAREWHKVLVSLLHDLDFVRSHSDPVLFIRKYGRCFIFIWVYDLIVFTAADVMETYVPIYCLDSKAGAKAKLDMSWAWKSCVIEKHGP